MLRKFCKKCKKELPAESIYYMCHECHKTVALREGDTSLYEYSRVHY